MKKTVCIVFLFLFFASFANADENFANDAEKLPITFMGITKEKSCDPDNYLDLGSNLNSNILSQFKENHSDTFDFISPEENENPDNDQILCTIILNTVDTTEQILAGAHKYYFRVGATIVFVEKDDDSLDLLYARNALFNQPVVNKNKLSQEEINGHFKNTLNECISELFNKSSEMYSPAKRNARITNLSKNFATINVGYKDRANMGTPIYAASGEKIGSVVKVKEHSAKIKLKKTPQGRNVTYTFNSKMIACSNKTFQVNKIHSPDNILQDYLGLEGDDIDNAKILFAQWLNDGLVQQGKINMYPPRLVLNDKMLEEFARYMGLDGDATNEFIKKVQLKDKGQLEDTIDFQINAFVAKAGTKVLKESKAGNNIAYFCLSYAGIVSTEEDDDDEPKKVLLKGKKAGVVTHKEINDKQIHKFSSEDFYRQAFHVSLFKLGEKFGEKIESDLNGKKSVL